MDNEKRFKFVWNRESIIALIELYRTHSVLYKTNDPQYHNKTKRQESLESIRMELNELSEFISRQCLEINDIKVKIHTLRTQFFKEYNKSKNTSSGAGTSEVIKPKLWCFDLLKFLVESETLTQSVSNLEESQFEQSTQSQIEIEYEDGTVYEGGIEDLSQNVTGETNKSEVSETIKIINGPGPTEETPKHEKTSIHKEVARFISKATTMLSEKKENVAPSDDIEAFSRYDDYLDFIKFL
ncbi:unnamed protein product [Psylliodes chrysocephalus]|uniref:MADF domain-containing protein n=1 Tax=Psylliodes chrysocephalus TaxID=3402493 RepID=A0A9P0CSL9_9CUCU|nr:unnamed protein product [Psylliodes chrysocephala]